MIRRISAVLSFLLVVGVVALLDNFFFCRFLQPDSAFAQSIFALEDFALYSQKEIKLHDIGDSRGNVGSNGGIDIKKGAPGSVIGSFQAMGIFKNEAQIGIYGDVSARVIEDKGALSVSGQLIERADLVPLALPALSFSASGPDLTISEKSSRSIAPGFYGRLKVKKGVSVYLSSGTYYFKKFELDESASANLDAGGGSIHINVVEKLKIKKDAGLQIVDGHPADIHLNYLGTDKVDMDDHAVLRGILTAPSAKVEFKKGSRLEGAVYAGSIHLTKDASFRHYDAGIEGHPPTADAGGYQTALAGEKVELDGSGSSDPDGDPITYHWSYLSYPDGAHPALSDPGDSMPSFTADRVGTYVIELSVDDGTYTSFRDTATVTAVSEVLDITDFVLYADDKIKMDKISGGVGDVGANRHIHIKKGPSGAIDGDLHVVGHIKNDGEITVAGDVFTSSKVKGHGTLTVTGVMIETAALTPRMLPPLSMSADGPDLKVPESTSQTIAPGSYGRVEVKKGATLQFTTGSYFLRELKTADSAILSCDVSEGGIELNVVKKLAFGKDTDLQIAGDGTRDVLINYAGKKEVKIEDRGVFRGTLTAPKAKVEFKKYSRLEGAVYAKKIYLDKGVHFDYHQNRPPVADSQAVSTLEDTPASFTLGGSDRDDDSLTFAVSSQPLHGTLDGTAPDLIYTPDLNYSGTDAFTFAVNDGTEDSEPATVIITVSAVNDAPVVDAQSIGLNEDEPKPVMLSGFDVEGDALAYVIIAGPFNGTLSGPAPNLIYTPNENYHGSDRFMFKANDGQADSQTATVSITINSINDAPVAVADKVTTDEDTAINAIKVLSNDTDVDGDTLLVSGFGPASHGNVADNGDGTCSYTPDANFHGIDSFTYTISDGLDGTAQGNIMVTVHPVNDAPVAVDDIVATEEDAALTVAVLANDTDVDGDPLVIANSSQGANGAVRINSDGTITYVPDTDFNGSDSFTYTVDDGNGGSDSATVNITVYPVNDAPVAGAQSVTLVEDTSWAIMLTGSDVDSDALAYAVVSAPAHGTLEGDAPNLTYTPDDNFNGVDAFSFTVNDGTVDSDPATVNITVAAVNDAPIAVADNVITDEDTTISAISVLGNDTDVDGDTLAVTAFGPASHGNVADNGDGTCSYTPDADFHGTDTFTYTISDDRGGIAQAEVTVTISPVNDAPVAVDDLLTTEEDAVVTVAILVNDTDVDGDLLVIANASHGANGAVSINPDGTITYIPNTDFNGSDSFIYTVDDGNGGSDTATVNITVNPVNDAPQADAQSVTVDEDTSWAIMLTGSDVDADALTYAVVSAPAHGTLEGGGPNLTYTPDENFNGVDAFSFTVNDGTVDSDPANVNLVVVAVNDAPVASAGSDQTVLVGDTVILNGHGSNDVDGDSLSYQWLFSSVPAGSTATFSDSSIADPGFVPDITGTYAVQLIVNDGLVDSASDIVVITADPRIVVVPDVVGQIQADAETALIEAYLTAGAISSAYNDSVPEDHVISQSPAGGSSVQNGSAVDLVISLGPVLPPAVNFNAGSTIIDEGQPAELSWSTTGGWDAHIDQGIGTVALNGSRTVTPAHTTTYTLTVTGIGGTTRKSLTIAVRGIVESQPQGSFRQQYEDLVPPDATVDQYDPKRFSLITGTVQNSAGAAISGVSVTILNHPEYGTVSTDAQGKYSIPVEGGGPLTVIYRKNGFITVHRKVYVPWNDIAVVKAAVMIAQDPASTTLTFDGKPETVITTRSTVVTDELGSRAFTMVFNGDNKAWLVDENGNDVHPLTTITTRATEYTTPESMPAKLPPTTAFTYCTELRVDGADRVRFEKPVIAWVDNFLNLPVGLIVPVGYYDRDKGVWVPDQNGVVVQLLDTDTDGLVDALDADGDGQPDDLNGNQSYGDEVQGLDDAQRYAAGSTFWRAATTHFSPSDWNLPVRAEQPSIPPNPKGRSNADQALSGNSGIASDGQAPGEQPPDDTECISSFVEQRGRIFHEDINIPGTNMTLHYASNRVAGYKPGVFTIPASGDIVPETLVKIVVQLGVAGKYYEVELPAEPNQVAEIQWDGRDNLGRPVTGTVAAHIRIGFAYNGYYTVPPSAARAFGLAGTSALTIPARQPVILWQDSELTVTRGEGTLAEGWSISAHHQMGSTDTSVLFKGDGSITRNNVAIIDSFAGKGQPRSSRYYSGMGGPATEAQIPTPSALAMDAGGNLFILSSYLAGTQNWQSHILKVDTQGFVNELLDASRMNGYDGYMAMDPQGNFYYSAYVLWGGNAGEGGCVQKITPQGVTTTVMGACGRGQFSHKGISFRGLHFDNQGNLYAASQGRHQVIKRDPAGFVTPVAGNGARGRTGDGGSAMQARLYYPEDVFVDDEGSIYIAEFGRVRKVDPSGIITTIAGGGSYPTLGDGGPALLAYMQDIKALALDAEGNLYLADGYRHSVRRVDNQGIISTVAGINYTVSTGYGGDGGAATNANIAVPTDILIDPAGNLFIADLYNHRVRKVNPTAAVLRQAMDATDIAFAEPNGKAHIMSGAGLHKKTVDLYTGVTINEFGYDEADTMISITDQFDNTAAVERDGNGMPTAIISPDGIRTDLTIDAGNHLTRVTYADGSYYDFEYTVDGLMTVKIEPQGNRFDHIFDDKGRLTDVTDEEGGHWGYSRTVDANGDVRVEMTTGENNVTSYLDYTDSTGAYFSTVTDSTGGRTAFIKSSDGLSVNRPLVCGTQLDFIYDIDPEYKFKVLSYMSESTPLGLYKVTQLNKTYQDTDSDKIPDLITDTVTVNNKTTKLTHNTLQAQKVVTSPEGRTLTTYYNPNTLLAETVSIPDLFDTNYGYDTQGRLTSIATGTRQTTAVYNAQGFLESVTDSENQTTTFSHDPVGRVTEITRPDGGFVGFTYDKNGNMTVLTKPVDIDHGFEFNRVNRKNLYQTPISGNYSYEYDKDRRLVQTNFPSGNSIFYDYTDPGDSENKSRLWRIETPEYDIDFTYLCGTMVGSITNGKESLT